MASVAWGGEEHVAVKNELLIIQIVLEAGSKFFPLYRRCSWVTQQPIEDKHFSSSNEISKPLTNDTSIDPKQYK